MENKREIKAAAILLYLTVFFSYSIAQGFSSLDECLITSDIGKFTYKARSARLGSAAGVVGGADHFKIDHTDSICNVSYSNISEIRGLPLEAAEEKSMSIKVQVTQHTGGDSDRWLLHEVEDAYRDGDDEDSRLGLFSGAGVKIREINGNKISYWGLGGGSYTWVSGQQVVDVKYTDLQRTKPEPIEVVKAYLAKHPSTITTTDAELKSSAYNVKWIKDEMDRRLWLCDKWNAQFQSGGVTQADLIYNLVNSIEVFLNYRQKYFGVTADADLTLLAGYQQKNDIASIQTKLAEYKAWWNKNKGRNIRI